MRRKIITPQLAWDTLLACVAGAALAMGWCDAVRAQEPFTDGLNQARASLGLGMAASNPGIAGVSGHNNSLQRAYGLGHHYTGGFAQCVAVGCGDSSAALSMWLASPAHAAILLDPMLASVGFACDGYAASVACSRGNPVAENRTGNRGCPTVSRASMGPQPNHPGASNPTVPLACPQGTTLPALANQPPVTCLRGSAFTPSGAGGCYRPRRLFWRFR